jgi:ribulose-phosphate 3-epimerase
VVLPKVRRARELVRESEHRICVQVDGGVDEDTIERCADAGADVFVAGSAVYGADDRGEAVRRLRERARAAAAGAWWGESR